MEIKPEDLHISIPARTAWSLREPTKVSIAHKPTGIVVESDKNRSQHANKQDCLDQLKVKLETFYELRKVEKRILDNLNKPRPVKYYIGETVIVYDEWLGMVTNITDKGIWVYPLLNTTDTFIAHDQTHSCYARHNVTKYKG